MAFSEKLKNEIQLYCTNHLPPDSLLGTRLFIKNLDFKAFFNVPRETFILIYTNISVEWVLFCPEG